MPKLCALLTFALLGNGSRPVSHMWDMVCMLGTLLHSNTSPRHVGYCCLHGESKNVDTVHFTFISCWRKMLSIEIVCIYSSETNVVSCTPCWRRHHLCWFGVLTPGCCSFTLRCWIVQPSRASTLSSMLWGMSSSSSLFSGLELLRYWLYFATNCSILVLAVIHSITLALPLNLSIVLLPPMEMCWR